MPRTTSRRCEARASTWPARGNGPSMAVRTPARPNDRPVVEVERAGRQEWRAGQYASSKMKFGLLSQMQVPKPWVEDTERNVYWQNLDHVVAAEHAGFSHFWLTEQH